jgi:hypothetical protein
MAAKSSILMVDSIANCSWKSHRNKNNGSVSMKKEKMRNPG